MKKNLILFLKIILSIALLAYLFHKIDIKQLFSAISQSDWKYLVLCIVLYGLGQVLSTYKWSLLIHSHGLQHPFRNLVSYYYIGMFFNLFMPSIVGGDIQRCYAVYRDEKSQSDKSLPRGRLSQIISSVMMERATGVVAMICLANIAYFFFSKSSFADNVQGDTFITVYLPKILISLLLGVIGLFVILYFWKSDKHQVKENKSLFQKVIIMINNLAIQLKSYLLSPKLFLQVMALSFVFQTLMIFLNVLLGYSLRLPVPLGYYFVIVPLVTICTALPISLSGLGVRECAYAYFLHFMGVDTTHAVLLSLIIFAVVAINALLGGLILFMKGFFVEKDIIQEE